MKQKLFIALLCMAGVFFLGACNNGINNVNPDDVDLSKLDNKTEKCWEVTRTVANVSETAYFWGTEYMLVYAMQQEQKLSGGIGKWSYKESNEKDEASCESKNPDYEPSYCWKITLSNGFQTMVNYIWSDEEGAKQYIATYEKTGWRASYAKADANDEDSCEKLNDEPQGPEQPEQPKDYSEYDDTTAKCWEVTVSVMGSTATSYVWCTERALVQSYDSMGYNYSYIVADANDEDACSELGQDTHPGETGEESCWLVSTTFNGYTETAYMWETEETIQRYVSGVTSAGGSASYQKSDASDRDACYAQELPGDDIEYPDGECWKITVSIMGGMMTQTQYIWIDEASLDIFSNALKSELEGQGMTDVSISYERSAADDKDACEAKNEQ